MNIFEQVDFYSEMRNFSCLSMNNYNNYIINGYQELRIAE